MEIIKTLIDFILHLNEHLAAIINEYGVWTYAILFLIVFVETGLVVMPFLPGDSLLIAAGTLAANEANGLNIILIILLLIVAALCGDNTNYFIGKFLAKKGEGAKLFGIFTIRKDYLIKTHVFYEKYGASTIIIARFVPIVRTFAPFVAGIGSMTYRKYILYCVVGAVSWVCSMSLLGYFFGQIECVKKNFGLITIAIIIISVMPIIVGFIKHRFKAVFNSYILLIVAILFGAIAFGASYFVFGKMGSDRYVALSDIFSCMSGVDIFAATRNKILLGTAAGTGVGLVAGIVFDKRRRKAAEARKLLKK